MKFLLNASKDTLATQANLVRWNKSTCDACKLCKCRETTAHILNNCKISLDQGKYTWRHNNIINYIVTSLDSSKFQIFSDLPGFQVAGGGSIPPEFTSLYSLVSSWENLRRIFLPFQSTHHTTYSYAEKNHFGLSPHCSCPHLMTIENPEALIVHPVLSQCCGLQL